MQHSDNKRNLISVKQYLEQRLTPELKKLIFTLDPHFQFKSIQDFFNSLNFHKFLILIMQQQVKQHLHGIELQQDLDQNQTYDQMNIKNFKQIKKIMSSFLDHYNIEAHNQISDSDIKIMIKERNMIRLKKILQNLFQIMVINQPLVEKIITLGQQLQYLAAFIQNKMPDFIEQQNLSSKYLQKSQDHEYLKQQQLQKIKERIQQFELKLLQKQEQLFSVKQQKKFIEEELNEKIIIIKKQQQELNRLINVDQFINSNQSDYFELLQQKKNIQISYNRKQLQFQNQIVKLQKKIQQIQDKNKENISILIKKHEYSVKQINSKYQNIINSKDKVIENLKDYQNKNKNALHAKNQQITSLTIERDRFECQMNNFKNQLDKYKKSENQRKKHYVQSPRSDLREDFQSQGQHYIRGNYSKLGDQVNFETQKSQLQQQLASISQPKYQSKKIKQIVQQNVNYKQKLNSLENQFKQVRDQLAKSKKKFDIQKRRNQEIQKQKKEEIDLMVGVIQQLFSQMKK